MRVCMSIKVHKNVWCPIHFKAFRMLANAPFSATMHLQCTLQPSTCLIPWYTSNEIKEKTEIWNNTRTFTNDNTLFRRSTYHWCTFWVCHNSFSFCYVDALTIYVACSFLCHWIDQCYCQMFTCLGGWHLQDNRGLQPFLLQSGVSECSKAVYHHSAFSNCFFQTKNEKELCLKYIRAFRWASQQISTQQSKRHTSQKCGQKRWQGLRMPIGPHVHSSGLADLQ